MLEQDDSLVRSDQAALRDSTAGEPITYEHVPARGEPLLWLAAAAWCWSRGGVWTARLQPMVGQTRTP